MIQTYEEILKEAEEKLKSSGVPDADWDAWLLFSDAFCMNRTGYFLNRKKTLQEKTEILERFRKLLEKRSERIPLQQLLGVQGFMGIDFKVTSDVLVPRADTETLCEEVLRICRESPGKTVLDVCTGSGCIAVSLAVLGNFARVDACDLSEAALLVAMQNAESHKAAVTFQKSDLLKEIKGRYDLIVSNPPYIKTEVIKTLEPEVKDHEPRMALDGGEDGLIFYRRLAKTMPEKLVPGGRIFLEIGYDQADAVTEILKNEGFSEIFIRKDLAGCDRVAEAVWNPKE